MRKVSLTEFKKLSAQDLKKSLCLEITADGETVAIVIAGAAPPMFARTRALCSVIDAGKPREV